MIGRPENRAPGVSRRSDGQEATVAAGTAAGPRAGLVRSRAGFVWGNRGRERPLTERSAVKQDLLPRRGPRDAAWSHAEPSPGTRPEPGGARAGRGPGLGTDSGVPRGSNTHGGKILSTPPTAGQ